MSTVLFYFLLKKLKIHFYSFRMKHRILITNNQKGGENMDNLFQYVLHYVLLTIMIVGALLLFPFFPKFVLFFSFFYYARDRYYHFDKRRYDTTRKQSSACKAVTLFFCFQSCFAVTHTYVSGNN